MLKVKELKKQKSITVLKNVPIMLSVMLISFIATQSRIGGYLSFVNVIIASLSGVWGVFSFVASLVSCIVFDTIGEAYVQLGSMIIISVIKLARDKNENCFYDGFITTASLLICSLSVSLIIKADASIFLYRILFSILSGCIVFFSIKLKNRYIADKKIYLYGADGIAFSIIFVLVLSALFILQFYSFNVGRALGIYISLLFSKKFRISGGGICSVLLLFSTLMCNPPMCNSTLVVCACSIISGALAGFGKIPMTAGFVLSSVPGLAVIGMNDYTFMAMTDIIVASVLFVVLPEEFDNSFMKIFKKKKTPLLKTHNSLCRRIDFMNYAIKDVDNQITTISAEISKSQKDNLPDAFENTKQLRDLLCQQLKITYNLLEDITSCANDFNKTDSELTEKAEMLFEKLGIHIQSVIVYKDFNDNIFVEAYKQGRFDTDVVKLTVELGIALNCDLAMPDSIFVNGLSKLTFSRASKFKITSGFKQLCSEGNDCCGDTLERVWISSNQYMVILSDGMGTGKRARLDSTFTTDLITRFSACGISPVTSLKFINSILRVKGWDESFATADIALFDTCNGKVDFIKSGAFDSFIVRDGSLIKIQSKAFPLGILTDAAPTVNSYKFYDGDLVIIASDGVSEKAVRLATEQLRKNNLSVCELSELICRYVKEYSTEQKNDDISVCVVSVKDC